MKWASAISRAARLEDAIEEAAHSIDNQLWPLFPDLVVVFASPEHADQFERIPALLRQHVQSVDTERGVAVIGCSAGGVIGGAMEIEDAPALSITAANLPGVDISPFHLPPDPVDWDEQLVEAGEGDPIFLLFPDPFSVRADALVDWFDATHPGSVKLGGVASGAVRPGEGALFLGEGTFRTGVVGLALAGNIAVETIVAQGCRPIGSPMFATRIDGNAILELDGRPAARVLESLYKSLDREDQELFQGSLFLGVRMNAAREVYLHGDFLIRNLIGLDTDNGALLVAADLEPHIVVQFHLRDARASAGDLDHMLSSRDGEPTPAGALLFSCMGRGQGLYGTPNHDSRLFTRRVGKVPLGGFFCNGEIGPVGGRTFLHSYTSSFVLFRPRSI